MNTLARFNDSQIIMQKGGIIEDGNQSETLNILSILRKRWKILFATIFIISSIGIPLIWIFVKPYYLATAAIRVAPVISSILFGGEEGIPMYRSYMYTQADLIISDRVLQRVVDDLADKNILAADMEKPDPIKAVKNKLTPKNSPDLVLALKKAIAGNKLTVAPEDNTELIKIAVKSSNPSNASKIANAFVQAYMTIVASEELKDGDHKLTVLENERRVMSEKIDRQRKTLNDMAQEFGTIVLDTRQQMMMNHLSKMQEKLTELELEKIVLQTKIDLHSTKQERTITPEMMAKLRHDFINSDLMVQTTASNVANLEQVLITAKQQLAPTNPELARKVSLLSALKQRLGELREEASKNFDDMAAKEFKESDLLEVQEYNEKLNQIAMHEQQLRDMLKNEDSKTIELGRKQLAMQDVKEQLDSFKEMHSTIQKRIGELEMERKRLARISVAYLANTAPYQDRRLQFTIAIMMLSIASGTGLSLLTNRLDMRLKTPDDIAKRIGVRIIGTTTSRDKIKESMWPRQLADDYHAICINLGLMNNCTIPNKLAITSAGPQEGKSTLAVNLATNLAKIGKKVLLIDGDLRKPDVAKYLNLDNKGKGMHQLLADFKLRDLLMYSETPGLSVLTAEPCDISVINRLIHHKNMVEFINEVSRIFDHVIIDTPPILAAVDALQWSSMVDGVILTSLAGRTETPDLKESIERLKQINVNLLGIVLSNVTYNKVYYPYGYGYYGKTEKVKDSKKNFPENDLIKEAK
ncbi:MAG: polysaccharide biosynthesis tyrosine autokinase [Phycisphaerales bacterium]